MTRQSSFVASVRPDNGRSQSGRWRRSVDSTHASDASAGTLALDEPRPGPLRRRWATSLHHREPTRAGAEDGDPRHRPRDAPPVAVPGVVRAAPGVGSVSSTGLLRRICSASGRPSPPLAPLSHPPITPTRERGEGRHGRQDLPSVSQRFRFRIGFPTPTIPATGRVAAEPLPSPETFHRHGQGPVTANGPPPSTGRGEGGLGERRPGAEARGGEGSPGQPRCPAWAPSYPFGSSSVPHRCSQYSGSPFRWRSNQARIVSVHSLRLS